MPTTGRKRTDVGIRLVVFLARAGIASRRKAGDLVKEGRVRINGTVVTEPGVAVDPERDHVRVDDKLVRGIAPHVYVMLHKPAGYVTTRSDPEQRPTVFDLLEGVKARVEAVGRLDYDTEGLLLFTNDGTVANKLMRPETHIPRVYDALVKGRVEPSALAGLREGVVVEGRKTKPAIVRVLKNPGPNDRLVITVHEGRYHLVKLMCEAVNHPVRKLRRVEFGPLVLGDLARGQYRFLRDDEVAALRAAVRA